MKKPNPKQPAPQNQGEGNVEAARHYNQEQKEFVDSGRAANATGHAAPRDDDEAQALLDAEQAGRSHAKGEDPTVPGANAKPPRKK